MKLSVFVFLTSLILPCTGFSAQLLNTEDIGKTENVVMTHEGRVFVASQRGVVEVIRTDFLNDGSQPGPLANNCQYDSDRDFVICHLADSLLKNGPCLLTGLTTDGTYLYSACTAIDTNDNLVEEQGAELFRILPGKNRGTVASVERHILEQPEWYNGMAVDDNGYLYLSASRATYNEAAIVRAKLPAHDEYFYPQFTAWLKKSNETMPNGIQIDGSTLYYSTGRKIEAININSSGSAGIATTLYTAGYLSILDDIAITPNHIAITEVDGYNLGHSENKIVLVEKEPSPAPQWCWFNCVTQLTIPTGKVRASSLVYDKRGLFYAPDTLIATSFFEGGLYLHHY
ncbi:MAG: hypothetical protein K6L73_12965 [Cellvibrionaceae bacterium]